MFAVAASIIIAETWRTNRNQVKRRDLIDDQIEDLGKKMDVVIENLGAYDQKISEYEKRCESSLFIHERANFNDQR